MHVGSVGMCVSLKKLWVWSVSTQNAMGKATWFLFVFEIWMWIFCQERACKFKVRFIKAVDTGRCPLLREYRVQKETDWQAEWVRWWWRQTMRTETMRTETMKTETMTGCWWHFCAHVRFPDSQMSTSRFSAFKPCLCQKKIVSREHPSSAECSYSHL